MAESLFILELELLHIRGGCSLIVVFFLPGARGTVIDNSYRVFAQVMQWKGRDLDPTEIEIERCDCCIVNERL